MQNLKIENAEETSKYCISIPTETNTDICPLVHTEQESLIQVSPTDSATNAASVFQFYTQHETVGHFPTLNKVVEIPNPTSISCLFLPRNSPTK